MYEESKEAAIENIKTGFDEFIEYIEQHIDFNNLSREDAIHLRFMQWEEDSDLFLFPLYLVPIIPEGLEIMYINGDRCKFDSEKVDNDIRFGCVAYGIEIKE